MVELYWSESERESDITQNGYIVFVVVYLYWKAAEIKETVRFRFHIQEASSVNTLGSLDFGQFFQKLHENGKKLYRGVGPLASAHGLFQIVTRLFYQCIGRSKGGAPGTRPPGPNSFIFK